MMSFEIPLDRWRSIERDLRKTFDEIERHRIEFANVETRLLDSVQDLHRADIGLALDVETFGLRHGHVPVPQAEALVYARRHALGHSSDSYYEMRRRVGEEHATMTLSTDLIREMHRHVLGAEGPGAGEWKRRPNQFPVYDIHGTWIASQLKTSPEDVPEFMERLHERYHSLRRSNVVDPILLCGAYTLDLFCIHPFWDGNGRTTRLALQLILHQSGHHVGRYVSFDGLLAQKKRVGYTGAIMQSEFGWRTAEHNPLPWCAFLAASILQAYREFFMRANRLVLMAGHINSLSGAIADLPERFHTADLTRVLPDVSEKTAILFLNRLRHKGSLRAMSSKDALEWQKIESQDEPPLVSE
jgi:Fic family protein